MLSLDAFRTIINRPDLSEEQLIAMKKTMECLARVYIEAWLRGEVPGSRKDAKSVRPSSQKRNNTARGHSLRSRQ